MSFLLTIISSDQSLSRVWLCDPMDFSTPGFPVHHQLLEPTQTHVHCVGDAIQPSHPMSSPSSPNNNSSIHSTLTECPITYLVPEERQTPATPSVVWQKAGWEGLCPLEGRTALCSGWALEALSSNQTASLTRNAPILPATPDQYRVGPFPQNGLQGALNFGWSAHILSLKWCRPRVHPHVCAYSLTSVMSDSLQPHGL